MVLGDADKVLADLAGTAIMRHEQLDAIIGIAGEDANQPSALDGLDAEFGHVEPAVESERLDVFVRGAAYRGALAVAVLVPLVEDGGPEVDGTIHQVVVLV